MQRINVNNVKKTIQRRYFSADILYGAVLTSSVTSTVTGHRFVTQMKIVCCLYKLFRRKLIGKFPAIHKSSASE